MTMTEERPTTGVEATIPGIAAAELSLAVRTVAMAASTDFARELLTGLLFEASAGVARISATDSYRIFSAEIHQPDVPDCRCVIPAAWFARAMPRRTSPADVYELRIGAGRVSWRDRVSGETFGNNALTEPNPNGASYPDVIRMLDGDHPMPETDTDLPRAFDPKRLGEIFKAASAWSKSMPVRVGQLDPMKPCRFEVTGGAGKLTMLLMPMRIPGT